MDLPLAFRMQDIVKDESPILFRSLCDEIRLSLHISGVPACSPLHFFLSVCPGSRLTCFLRAIVRISASA